MLLSELFEVDVEALAELDMVENKKVNLVEVRQTTTTVQVKKIMASLDNIPSPNGSYWVDCSLRVLVDQCYDDEMKVDRSEVSHQQCWPSERGLLVDRAGSSSFYSHSLVCTW